MVYNGFLNLTEDERRQLMGEIQKFLESSRSKQFIIIEDTKKIMGVVLGPTGRACPCCGS